MTNVIRWKLNEVMAKRRVRNKDLAEALDITENSVYRLRKTDEMPRLTPERLDGICAVLQCQPGDLLEWVPDGGELLEWVADSSESQAVPKQMLNRLTKFCDQILALSWKGYIQFGRGAVIYTEKVDGPEIAYIERERLSDPECYQAIDNNRPERAAVVLYYYDSDYETSDYSVFILTGSKTPPECYATLSDR